MLKGIAASRGIAIGKAVVLEEAWDACVLPRTVSIDEVKTEVARFEAALRKAETDVRETERRLEQRMGRKFAHLFEAYALILQDPMLRDEVIRLIERERVNAEGALSRVVEKLHRTFSEMEDAYLRERGRDVLDAGRKILEHLVGAPRIPLEQVSEASVVIAHNLTPADTVALRDAHVLAFATEIGGRDSHTAILAQSLEIPAVVGLKDVTSRIKSGTMVIVDGNQGLVVVDPDARTIESYRREQGVLVVREKALEQLRDQPAVTKDGVRVVVAANIDDPSEVRSVLSHGGEGVGLYRTESAYLNRKEFPPEEELFSAYRQVAEGLRPHPVVFRIVDVGGDRYVQPFNLVREENPNLGLRGIRFCLRHQDVFRTQIRALLRASAHGKIQIMFPMVSRVEEFRAARAVLEEVKAELRLGAVPFDATMASGVMIEVPSAALTADAIARESDFLSIGTNDLIQFTTAVDRLNENVADLADPLHPAVLRLLKMIIDAGHACGKPVSMCGQMAGDPLLVPVLLGLGLDVFSVAPSAIPVVKQAVREATMKDAKQLATEILALTERSRIRELLTKGRP